LHISTEYAGNLHSSLTQAVLKISILKTTTATFRKIGEEVMENKKFLKMKKQKSKIGKGG
jgi:isocitrate dehydrogenase